MSKQCFLIFIISPPQLYICMLIGEYLIANMMQ